jgi:hypothetical protein
MTRASLSPAVLVSFFALLLSTALAPRASAQEVVEADLVAPPSRDATRFLATTTSAVVGTSSALTAAYGGYDGAAHTPTFSVGTELRLVRRVSLVGGVAYGNASAANAGLRPQLGARVQLLGEAASGVDASLGFLFRQDRFTSEDGLFQGSLALGRTFGQTSAVLNVIYGQDGEGDDHEGEVRLAGLRHVRGGLHAGVEGRYLRSINSTDPHRVMLGTPSMEAMGGPIVAYMAGSWALVAEAGVSTRRTTRLDTGLIALGGIGTTF